MHGDDGYARRIVQPRDVGGGREIAVERRAALVLFERGDHDGHRATEKTGKIVEDVRGSHGRRSREPSLGLALRVRPDVRLDPAFEV